MPSPNIHSSCEVEHLACTIRCQAKPVQLGIHSFIQHSCFQWDDPSRIYRNQMSYGQSSYNIWRCDLAGKLDLWSAFDWILPSCLGMRHVSHQLHKQPNSLAISIQNKALPGYHWGDILWECAKLIFDWYHRWSGRQDFYSYDFSSSTSQLLQSQSCRFLYRATWISHWPSGSATCSPQLSLYFDGYTHLGPLLPTSLILSA